MAAEARSRAAVFVGAVRRMPKAPCVAALDGSRISEGSAASGERNRRPQRLGGRVYPLIAATAPRHFRTKTSYCRTKVRYCRTAPSWAAVATKYWRTETKY